MFDTSTRAASARLSRYRRLLPGGISRWKVSALLTEVRGSLPCLTTQEGSPRCHRMPCGGSPKEYSNITLRGGAALLPGLNARVSAPRSI